MPEQKTFSSRNLVKIGTGIPTCAAHTRPSDNAGHGNLFFDKTMQSIIYHQKVVPCLSFQRRHLNAPQRAVIALEVLPMLEVKQ